ncbi:MAG: FHA domain-containing protein [Planctomycetaceae bacterium]|nr:FHA domain-containing protein [Planctomycetaceae bacterium]
MHASASVALGDGEHRIGSSEDCDIILADSGVQESHLRLRVEGNAAFCLVYDGGEATLDGVEIGAEEVELPHYAEVRLGGSSFRIGPETGGDWPAIAAASAFAEETAGERAATPTGEASGGYTRPSELSNSNPMERVRVFLAELGVVAKVAALVVAIAFVIALWLWRSHAASETRLRTVADILESRGFSIAQEGGVQSAQQLRLTLEGETVHIAGAVDFERQIDQIRMQLAGAAVDTSLALAARDVNVREAGQWLRDEGIPLDIRILGKTRAAVYGFVEDAERTTAAYERIRGFLTGFDSLDNEIVNWPAARTTLEEILARHDLRGLELSPEPYRIVVTGILRTPEAEQAWRDAEGEFQSTFRFTPSFVWRRPADEYLRLVRETFAERRIGLEAVLTDRRTLLVQGFVANPEVSGRVRDILRVYMNDWTGGTLEERYTYWEEARPVLRASLDKHGLGDVEILEAGDYQAYLMGETASEERAAAWERVETDMELSLAYPPPVVWRKPPPPEDAWLEDAQKLLRDSGFSAFKIVAPGSENSAVLNLAKGGGKIVVSGAVETAGERQALLTIAEAAPFPFSVSVVSRKEALETVGRILADKGASLAFERFGMNRLMLRGLVRDVETGKNLFAEIRPYLDCFAGVEERFVTWAEIRRDAVRFLEEAGLGSVTLEPADFRIEAEGELQSADEREGWERFSAMLAARVGAEVGVDWKEPPPPAEARPSDVVARLRAMGLDPVLLGEDDVPRPLLLSVRPEGKLIRVTGVVETTAEKRNVQSLFDEGMVHLAVDLSVREEILRQAERFLMEMEINLSITRLGTTTVMLKGYVLDLAAGEMLLSEMRSLLTCFSDVEADFTHWIDLRPVLLDRISGTPLEQFAVYPGEFEIVVVGKASEEELAAWRDVETTVIATAGAPVKFDWQERLPAIRRGRLARRRGLSDPSLSIANIEALTPVIDSLAASPIDLTGAIAEAERLHKEELARLEEERARAEQERLALETAAVEAEAEAARNDWRMRLVEMRIVSGQRQVRIDGSNRWYREGELIQGHLVVQIFDNGMMLVKEDNMVIYTVEAPEEEEHGNA